MYYICGKDKFSTMKKLFEYSRPVENQDFVGRKLEIEKISTNFIFLTNTILLAPQGLGKSSLIRKAAAVASGKEKKLRFCYMDLFNVRNEERFFELFVESILKAISPTFEDVVNNLSKFFTHPVPKLNFTSPAVDGIKIDFDWVEVRKYREWLLGVPAKIAESTGLKLVICVDNFHAIENFDDADSFMALLKSYWNSGRSVAYCLTAQENVAIADFMKKVKPFSVYADVIRLEKLDSIAFSRHLRDKFADSGKYLDAEIASLIVNLVDSHPSYVQQLAHLSWMNTSVVCSKDVVMEAHQTIVNQMHNLFSIITASLTTQQLCYIHAVLEGETIISTSEVLHRHHITSATSASRSKVALLQKGILYNVGGKMTFSDPLYAYWLRNRYFNKCK